MAENKDTRTLLVRDGEGRFKITIPADWKITFGKAITKGGFDATHDHELRMYEAETKQRACFTGVLWFRDVTIPVEREVVSKTGSHSWEVEADSFTEKRDEKITRKLVKEEL